MLNRDETWANSSDRRAGVSQYSNKAALTGELTLNFVCFKGD